MKRFYCTDCGHVAWMPATTVATQCRAYGSSHGWMTEDPDIEHITTGGIYADTMQTAHTEYVVTLP